MTDVSKIDMERINGLLDKLEEVTDKLNSMKYVVETYSNGNQWYRKWSDGWIEQGNYQSLTFSGYISTLSFVTSFKTINYTFVVTGKSNDTSSYFHDNVNIGPNENKKVNSIQLSAEQNTTIKLSWYACGY